MIWTIFRFRIMSDAEIFYLTSVWVYRSGEGRIAWTVTGFQCQAIIRTWRSKNAGSNSILHF